MNALGFICSEKALREQALAMDMASGELYKELIASARGVSFHGSSFATDESPPSSNRDPGLKAQNTMSYALFFAPQEEWESGAYDDAYPFIRDDRLLDITNVANETGQSTLHAILQQHERIGIFKDDLKAGCGDGGGEDEGSSDVNQLMDAEDAT